MIAAAKPLVDGDGDENDDDDNGDDGRDDQTTK